MDYLGFQIYFVISSLPHKMVILEHFKIESLNDTGFVCTGEAQILMYFYQK